MEEHNEHNEELSQSPILDSLKKKGVFDAPDGYFDSLGEKMNDRIHDLEVMEKDAPTLAKLDKTPFFQVPEGYFDGLGAEVSARLGDEEEVQKGKRNILPLLRKPYLWVSVAAAFALLITVNIWPQTATPTLDDLTNEELLAMIRIEEYDTQMLIESLGEESLEDIPVLDEVDLSEDEIGELLDDLDVADLARELMNDK